MQTRSCFVSRVIESAYTLLTDEPTIHAEWKSLVFAVGAKGKQVHDARLAAIMVVHRVTHILTFNTDDFKRYPGIVAVDPATVP
jgi:predicted nucleic acid-binding protein